MVDINKFNKLHSQNDINSKINSEFRMVKTIGIH